VTSSPTASLTPAGGRAGFGAPTGIAEVDGVIAALQRGTVEAIASYIRMTDVPCTDAQGSGGPPQCGAYGSTKDPSRPPPPPPGTIVPAFPVSSCDAGWLNDPALIASSLVPRIDRLVAVVRLTKPIAIDPDRLRPSHGLIVGTEQPQVAALLFIDGGHITGVKWTCGEPALSLLRPPTSDFYGAPEVLLQGPAWP